MILARVVRHFETAAGVSVALEQDFVFNDTPTMATRRNPGGVRGEKPQAAAEGGGDDPGGAGPPGEALTWLHATPWGGPPRPASVHAAGAGEGSLGVKVTELLE
jgi:hypothetical protein